MRSVRPVFSRKSVRGFTFVEVVIVVSAIAILSAIVLMAVENSRKAARDTKRLEDLSHLQDALAVYYSENHVYPDTGGTLGSAVWYGTCASWGSRSTSGSTGWIPNLAPTYIPVLPTDPKPILPSKCYVYSSFNNDQDYMILALGTVETFTPATNPKPRPAIPTEASFAAYTDSAINQ